MDAAGSSNAPADGGGATHPSSSSIRNRRRRKKKRSRQEAQEAANVEASTQPEENEVLPRESLQQSADASELANNATTDRERKRESQYENRCELVKTMTQTKSETCLPQDDKRISVNGEKATDNNTKKGENIVDNDTKKQEKAAVSDTKKGEKAADNNAKKQEKAAGSDAKKQKAAGSNAKKGEEAVGNDANKQEKAAGTDTKGEKAARNDAKKGEKVADNDAKKEEKTGVNEVKKVEKVAGNDAMKEEKAGVNDVKKGEDAQVKTKSQLKAERRAKQEAQRAAKAEKLQAGGKEPPTKQQPAKEGAAARKISNKPLKEEKTKPAPVRAHKKSEGGGDEDGRTPSSSHHPDEIVRVPTELRQDDPQQVKKKIKRMGRQNIFQRAEIHKKVALFSHLPQHQIENGVLPDAWKAGSSLVHPAFYRVGVQMAYGSIIGANNRCMALAEALTAFIDSFQRPDDKEFGRFMESQFSPNITFLSECRPLSAGMRAFVKNFKAKVVTVGHEEHPSDDARKEELKTWISDFIEEKIMLAGKMIAKNASGKISAGSCLLTFAFSSTVAQVFRHARHEQGLDFTVIVADCEPLFEGRRMIRVLESNGIPCEYVSLTGVASVMSRVAAVFIGAQAIFNNGSVLARAGTGLVASIAEEFHRPLHVCCESYKFWERVQLDAFVYNELGDPGLLVGNSGPMREEWEKPKSPLHYLNLLYDVTPPDLIDIVVTELCLMPSSSVPVVLRRHAI